MVNNFIYLRFIQNYKNWELRSKKPRQRECIAPLYSLFHNSCNGGLKLVNLVLVMGSCWTERTEGLKKGDN